DTGHRDEHPCLPGRVAGLRTAPAPRGPADPAGRRRSPGLTADLRGRRLGPDRGLHVPGARQDPQRVGAPPRPLRHWGRDARVSVIVLSDDWNGPWAQIDGTAEVVDAPDSVEPLVEYYRNIAGEHPDWDEYRAAMVRQGKSIIRITPERWGPVATGGFPARLVEGE
ncbi:LOW QUALITY PROTEIN: ATP/GTP-binding protein, partial [Streptomyces viridosporus ATCC 14672]